jgi:hypothetical protein
VKTREGVPQIDNSGRGSALGRSETDSVAVAACLETIPGELLGVRGPAMAGCAISCIHPNASRHGPPACRQAGPHTVLSIPQGGIANPALVTAVPCQPSGERKGVNSIVLCFRLGFGHELA